MNIYEEESDYRKILTEFIGRSKEINALSNWNDLMSVVKKIESEVLDVIITKSSCSIITNDNMFNCALRDTEYGNKNEMVFICCIKYIESK